MIAAGAMHGRCEAHDDRPDAAVGERERVGRIRHARMHGRVGHVPLGADAARRQPQRAGGDEQRAARTLQTLGEDLDGRAIGLRRGAHPRKIVVVAEMHDALGTSGRGAQAVGIVQGTAHHLGPEPGDLGGGFVGSRQAEDMVTGRKELSDAGGSDPAGCARDKNSHGNVFRVMSSSDISMVPMSLCVNTGVPPPISDLFPPMGVHSGVSPGIPRWRLRD